MDVYRMCPNCKQNEAEAYKKGYNDAMKMFEKELSDAHNSRPFVIVVPKDQKIVEVK